MRRVRLVSSQYRGIDCRRLHDAQCLLANPSVEVRPTEGDASRFAILHRIAVTRVPGNCPVS